MTRARVERGIRVLIVAAWLAAMTVDCASRAKVTGLRVVCSISDASVFVDGKYVGRLQVLKNRLVALPPGTHRIVVRRQGFFPRYRMVTVRRNEVVIVRAVLRRVLPAVPQGAVLR